MSHRMILVLAWVVPTYSIIVFMEVIRQPSFHFLNFFPLVIYSFLRWKDQPYAQFPESFCSGSWCGARECGSTFLRAERSLGCLPQGLLDLLWLLNNLFSFSFISLPFIGISRIFQKYCLSPYTICLSAFCGVYSLPNNSYQEEP